MAKTKPAPPPPDYGRHKQQVIAVLRELLLKGHKPTGPLMLFRHDGREHLRFVCERCRVPHLMPAEGAFEMPWCALPGHAQNGEGAPK